MKNSPDPVSGTVIWRRTYVSHSMTDGMCSGYSGHQFRDMAVFPNPLQGRVSAEHYLGRLEAIKHFIGQYDIPASRKWVFPASVVLFEIVGLSLIIYFQDQSPTNFPTAIFLGVLAMIMISLIAAYISGKKAIKTKMDMETKMEQLFGTFNAQDNRIGLYWRPYYKVIVCRRSSYDTVRNLNYNPSYPIFVNEHHYASNYYVYLPAFDVSLVDEAGSVSDDAPRPAPNAMYVPLEPIGASLNNLPPPYLSTPGMTSSPSVTAANPHNKVQLVILKSF